MNTLILWFKLDHCNFLPQTELSTLSRPKLINQHSLSWIWSWSRRTDASTKWPVWRPLMFRIEWKALSVWLKQIWSSGWTLLLSPLICGISDEVFWEIDHVQHGWHRKREVYYYIHNRCIMWPLNVIALDNKTSNQVESVNKYCKSFTQNNQLVFV